jgi:NADPH:quinone reductase-like Zn-dependent oxidoreductase
VLATVGAAWKQGPARQLGAEAVFDHHEPRLAKRVVELTDGGVDVVLDHVGAPVFTECLDALRPFGRYVTTGVTAGHRAQLHLGRVFERGLAVLGVGRPDAEHVRRVMLRLLALVGDGAVRPVIHAVLPLDRIAEGHALLESSSFVGKVVLVP